MSSYQYQHTGACGCGAVTFTYHVSQPLEALQARACQCDYCAPKAATYLSDPDSELEVTVRDSRHLYAHRFGTSTADFIHCAFCNEQVYVQCEVEGRYYALVSAPALTGFDRLAGFNPVDYEGEALAERLQRRSERWIPVLRVTADNAG